MDRANAERDLYSIFGFANAESISEWLRLALTDAMGRDPADAADDAETLASILAMRSELMIRSGSGCRP